MDGLTSLVVTLIWYHHRVFLYRLSVGNLPCSCTHTVCWCWKWQCCSHTNHALQLMMVTWIHSVSAGKWQCWHTCCLLMLNMTTLHALVQPCFNCWWWLGFTHFQEVSDHTHAHMHAVAVWRWIWQFYSHTNHALLMVTWILCVPGGKSSTCRLLMLNMLFSLCLSW